ncbi:MAG: flavin prenyltransferase, partial [Mycobacterium sp.]|nr:flavin prenyltransferase [Mycobacterium sp.]
ISGATGIIYGIRALQMLRELDIETHLIVSRAGEMTREYETALKLAFYRRDGQHGERAA